MTPATGMKPLINELVEHGHEFSFVQAMRLARRYLDPEGEAGIPRMHRLTRYTRFYLTDPLEVEVELVLASGEARPIRLGGPGSSLGLNMWCFSGDTLGEMSAVFRMAAQPEAAMPAASHDPPARQSRGFVPPEVRKGQKPLALSLFEARKRYGLKILNYMVTSNHIQLLVVDSGPDVISKSLQLIAGRTAQEFNARKKRKGAFR